MNSFKKALDKMGEELGSSISDLRRDVLEQFAEVRQTMGDQQTAIEAQQRAMEEHKQAIQRQDQAMTRQAHILDQGLAGVNDIFNRHRENIGKVVLTFVEDLHAVKTDLRGLTRRVEEMERGGPPAA